MDKLIPSLHGFKDRHVYKIGRPLKSTQGLLSTDVDIKRIGHYEMQNIHGCIVQYNNRLVQRSTLHLHILLHKNF